MTEEKPSGAEIRERVLGSDYVERARARRNSFNSLLQDYAISNVWGDLWLRDGIDARTRSIVTLSVLLATGSQEELAMHVKGAVRNGLSVEEIAEVLLHAGVYAGLPRAVSAFPVAQRALEELGIELEAHDGIQDG